MGKKVIVKRSVEKILGWPTDIFSIDVEAATVPVHTRLIFVPGNPGLVEWYIPVFSNILQKLGPGYDVRGASYAGHSIDPVQISVESDVTSLNENEQKARTQQRENPPPKTLACTIDGQVHHKIAYLEKLSQEMDETVQFVFVGHSIGCHLTHRILLYREDFLRRTTQCIFLMPFIRMDAPFPHQQLLDLTARHPVASTWILQTASRLLALLSPRLVERLLHSTMDLQEHRTFTANLLQQSEFARNFLGLGLEEIRDVPQAIDVTGLRYINASHNVPITMLFAGNDHWGPYYHVEDLRKKVNNGLLSTLEVDYNPALKHDFVTSQSQSTWVVDYCIKLIQRQTTARRSPIPQSRL